MKPKAIYQLPASMCDLIYGAPERAEIAKLVEDVPRAEAEVIFTGWGAPKMDATYLATVPNLKLVLYAAGSVRGMVAKALFASGPLAVICPAETDQAAFLATAQR